MQLILWSSISNRVILIKLLVYYNSTIGKRLENEIKIIIEINKRTFPEKGFQLQKQRIKFTGMKRFLSEGEIIIWSQMWNSIDEEIYSEQTAFSENPYHFIILMKEKNQSQKLLKPAKRYIQMNKTYRRNMTEQSWWRNSR